LSIIAGFPAEITWESFKVYAEAAWVKSLLIALGAMIALFISRLIIKIIIKRVERPTEDDKREWELRAKTLIGITNNFITIGLLLVAFFLILSELGINIAPLLAAAGIAGLAIGFGAQSLVKDFLTGFFVLLENQYRVGDVIKIGDIGGTVEKFTLRTTVLRDIEGTIHFIPNGEIKTVGNMTYQWSRMLVEVGVAYKEEVDKVIEVLKNLSSEFYSEEGWKDKLLEEPQVVGVQALADSQVTIRVMAKAKPMTQWELMREFRRRVKNRFDELGIEIPFPHQTVYLRKES